MAWHRVARIRRRAVAAVLAALLVAAASRAGPVAAHHSPRLPTADSLLPLQPCWAPADAAAHVGERGCVEGTVTNAVFAQRSTGQPTFLDFGPEFTAVVWGEDRAKFSPAPETRRGQRLRVSGPVTSFRGKAQIVVREPAQLGLAGASQQTTPATTVATAAATVAPVSAAPAATAVAPTPPPAMAATTAATQAPATPRIATAFAGNPPDTQASPAGGAMPPAIEAPAEGPAAGGGAARSMVLAGVGLIGVGAAGAAWYGLRRRR